MSEVASVKIIDNSDKIKVLLQGQIGDALEAVGIQAEGYAKLELENHPRRIDTGLLRNSITHAVSGEPAAVSSYHSNSTDKNGKPIDVQEGHYSGTAPKDSPIKRAVYIGTNVEYAVYVHNGTMKMKKNAFLKNAVTKHKDEYKAIFKTYLGK